MRTLLLVAVLLVGVGIGLKIAGIPLPFIDYPLGSMGVDTPGPAMPDVEIKPPGFGEFPAP